MALPTQYKESITLEESPDSAMIALETAAEAKDQMAFLQAKRAIDWEERPAEDFVRAVDLALMAGAYVAARNLAAEGAERYPKHAELKKMAYILAPPKVVRSGPADPGVKANWEWFKAHGGQYRGRWVALHNGDLLKVADSYNELVEQVNDSKEARILITKVY